MRQRDLFLCGAVLSALAVFVCLRSIQEPLYAGIGGGLCALAAAALFGCGLWADTRERSDSRSRHLEEGQRQLEEGHRMHTEALECLRGIMEALEREAQSVRTSVEEEGLARRADLSALLERLDAHQQSYVVALGQIQTETAAVTGKLETLRGAVAAESRSRSKAATELSEGVRSGFTSNRKQAEESAKAVCDSMLALHTALRQALECQGRQAENYYKFMIAQPWAEIRALSETLQSAADQIGDIWSSVDSIHSDTERQMKKALNQLTEDSGALRKKLQDVCETLERQGRETTEVMDRMIQSYSDITAQDMEVLTALAREEGL